MSFDQDFYDVFGEGFDEVRQSLADTLRPYISRSQEECEHADTITFDDKFICRDCGVETSFISYVPEWRYYGNSDSHTSRDPSRCHARREARKGIDTITMHLNIPQPVKVLAEHRYAAIVGEKTTRGDTRAGIVAACIFYAFIHTGNKRTGEEVRKMFKLSKKDMSKGLSRYLDVFAVDRTISNKPIDLIPRTMNRVGIDTTHYPAILALANMLDGTSRNMSHSCPQSVAASIVYLYLCINDEYRQRRGITKSMFAKLVSLSDITISRHLREACEILEKLQYPGIENAKRNMKRRKNGLADNGSSSEGGPVISPVGRNEVAAMRGKSEYEPPFFLVKLHRPKTSRNV